MFCANLAIPTDIYTYYDYFCEWINDRFWHIMEKSAFRLLLIALPLLLGSGLHARTDVNDDGKEINFTTITPRLSPEYRLSERTCQENSMEMDSVTFPYLLPLLENGADKDCANCLLHMYTIYSKGIFAEQDIEKAQRYKKRTSVKSMQERMR